MSSVFDDGSYQNRNLLREAAMSKRDCGVQRTDDPDCFKQAEVPDIRFSIAKTVVLLSGVVEQRWVQTVGECLDQPF